MRARVHMKVGVQTAKETKGEMITMTKIKTPRAGGRPSASRQSADPLGTNTEIGRKLKQYYDELVSDDVPDRFAAAAEPAGTEPSLPPKKD